MSDISKWSSSAGSNNSAPPNGFPEGQSPSTLNDGMREVMASVRRQAESAEWFDWGDAVSYASNTSFTVTGDTTSRYTVGRRVKITGVITGTVYGLITTSVFSTLTTVSVEFDSGNINNEVLSISLAVTSKSLTARSLSFKPTSSNSATNVQDAITNGAFPSGTKVVFYQASAPTGWTQDVSAGDRLMRVVATAGGGYGGADNPIAFDHAHTTAGHSLTVAEMPPHTHTFDRSGDGTNASNGPYGSIINANTRVTLNTGSTGSGGAHSHGNTGGTAIRPKYIDVIIAAKN